MRILSLLAVFFAAALTGCAASATGGQSAIAAGSEAWGAALNAGDVDAVVALYTKDARILGPNNEMKTGVDAIRAEFGAMVNAGLKGEITRVETVASGDIGYNVGTFLLKGPDGSVVDRGKFIETWRNDGGTWRISNDIYNSDMKKSSGGSAITITHDVADGEHWLAAWRGENSRKHMFKKHGVAHVHAMQDRENANKTALVVSVTDMDAFEAFLASDDGQQAAAEDGVIFESLRTYIEKK